MKRISMVVIFIILLSSISSFGQKKIDLEDLHIKGELHNDNRLRILARDKNKIKDYVKLKTNFRDEIVEGLLKPLPKQKY